MGITTVCPKTVVAPPDKGNVSKTRIINAL